MIRDVLLALVGVVVVIGFEVVVAAVVATEEVVSITLLLDVSPVVVPDVDVVVDELSLPCRAMSSLVDLPMNPNLNQAAWVTLTMDSATSRKWINRDEYMMTR